nr:HNH endonuclease [uncultured Bdellovibrio sp.]
MSKERRSGVTEEQKEKIWDGCDKLVQELSTSVGLSKFQVAKEIHYRIQRADEYRINPSERERSSSLKAWGNACWKCKKEFDNDREFHHLRRDIDDPHNPSNMVPICKSCHAKC